MLAAQHLARDPRHQLRLAGAHDDRRTMGRVVARRRPGSRDRGDACDLAVLAQHVDRAPAGQARHQQGGQPLQGVLAGTGRRQQLTGPGEEREPSSAVMIERGHRHLTRGRVHGEKPTGHSSSKRSRATELAVTALRRPGALRIRRSS